MSFTAENLDLYKGSHKKNFFSGWITKKRGGGRWVKAEPLRKNNFFEDRKKKSKKIRPLSSRGGALVVGPLKKSFFCGFTIYL